LKEIEEKNDELSDIESTLNSLKIRCGPVEVEATEKQFTSVCKKLQASFEKATKVK